MSTGIFARYQKVGRRFSPAIRPRNGRKPRRGSAFSLEQNSCSGLMWVAALPDRDQAAAILDLLGIASAWRGPAPKTLARTGGYSPRPDSTMNSAEATMRKALDILADLSARLDVLERGENLPLWLRQASEKSARASRALPSGIAGQSLSKAVIGLPGGPGAGASPAIDCCRAERASRRPGDGRDGADENSTDGAFDVLNDTFDLIRGQAASDRLDLAKASGDPVAGISARRKGEAVLSD